ncbi:hypothetical protein LUR56_39845 [Streptomyces sp. MT29]|nr:hypothetical protein [Streptomyces sp. MT29]
MLPLFTRKPLSASERARYENTARNVVKAWLKETATKNVVTVSTFPAPSRQEEWLSLRGIVTLPPNWLA